MPLETWNPVSVYEIYLAFLKAEQHKLPHKVHANQLQAA